MHHLESTQQRPEWAEYEYTLLPELIRNKAHRAHGTIQACMGPARTHLQARSQKRNTLSGLSLVRL